MANQKELREAYKAGLRRGEAGTGTSFDFTSEDFERLALDAYPPKAVTRPREITVPHGWGGAPRIYRVVDGVIQVRGFEGEWRNNNEPEFFGMLVDLIRNPTETVEDD